jgi:hypothetical protein
MSGAFQSRQSEWLFKPIVGGEEIYPRIAFSPLLL